VRPRHPPISICAAMGVELHEGKPRLTILMLGAKPHTWISIMSISRTVAGPHVKGARE
jgi:hypothetical protein